MINLTAIGKKPDKAKTEYPAIQDAGATALCDTVLKLSDEFDALKGSLDLHKAELVGIAKPEYFKRFNGHADVPSSMSARASDGREVLVSLTNRYKKPSDEDLIRALMGEHAGRLLQKSFTLELDSNKVPLDKQQQVVDELVAVLTKFGCQSALTATAATGPSDDFHIARHLLFPASAGWSPDAELVDILDGYSSMIRTAVDQCVKEWVEANGIKPKLTIGAKVALPEGWCKSHSKQPWPGGQGIGEITGIPDYKAGTYAVRAPWQTEGSAYLLDFAEVEAFTLLR